VEKERSYENLYYIHGLHVGGAETLITNYLIRLKEEGNDVALVVNCEEDTFLSEKLRERAIKIIPLFSVPRFFLGRCWNAAMRRIIGCKAKWRRIYKQENPDIVHIHTFCDDFEACTFPTEKIFFTFHAEVRRSLSLSTKRGVTKLRRLVKNGMKMIALSPKAVVDVKEILETDHVIYIPNAVDLEEIRKHRYDRETFLKEHGLSDDAFLVGHVGRFHSVKNHEKLFAVFQEVHKMRPSARLVLIGTGNQQEKARIAGFMAQYGVQDATIMLGLRSDAAAIMSVFDVFVLTSTSESFSLVLVEAQVQGVRCVASNVVPPEVVCENCVALDLTESNRVWANCVLHGGQVTNHRTVEQFDVSNIITQLIKSYRAVLCK